MNPNLSQRSRVPYWAIWLGLIVVLAILVSGAFLLNRQFRARIGIQEGTVNLTVPSAVASPAPPTSVVAPVTSPVVSPTTSNATSPAPSASGDNSSLGQEVAAAYKHYWAVYSDALLNLDTSQVSQVATGDELQRMQQEVAGFRAKNHALRVVVDHHFFVFDVTPTDAKVYDETSDRSYTVDPVTKQPPTGPDQADIEKDIYFLRDIDGTWKVTKSVRQSVSAS